MSSLKQRNYRLSVVFFCYLISSYGIAMSMSIGYIATFQFSSAILTITGIAILFAWTAHAVMSIEWISNNKSHRVFPILGTFAGLFALFCWPDLDLLDTTPSLKKAQLAAIFVFPCLLLAPYLVWFHLSSSLRHGDGDIHSKQPPSSR